MTTGATLEDTRTLMREALAFHIEGMREDGQPVPDGHDEAVTVELLTL